MEEQDRILNNAYLKEDWGQLLDEIGFVPVNMESCARRVAEYACSKINALQCDLLEAESSVRLWQELHYAEVQERRYQ